MSKICFIDNNGSFRMENAENDWGLYFPLANETGLKSAITPNLAGDAKLDQNHFLLEPVSIENLHNNKSTRNFWVKVANEDGKTNVWSVAGASYEQEINKGTDMQDSNAIEAGFMWHKEIRSSKVCNLSAEVLHFIPVRSNMEIMTVTITNEGKESVLITPTAAIPVYGRSADNIRDHRHVTSLLHRAITNEYSIEVTPTLSFDERGHQVNDTCYFVAAMEGDATAPIGFYPEADAYVGAKGSYLRPAAVYSDDVTMLKKGEKVDGCEIVGAIRFADKKLSAGERVTYTVFFGACDKNKEVQSVIKPYFTLAAINESLKECKEYWTSKCNVKYSSSDEQFNQFMNWINFQPELRRVFGCSFLPHHDYGKGGRGWRDLWQDCLALLVMNPDGVRQMIIDNYAGVRTDGSNATIIGEKSGEFKADRNSITRVWMDHGVWPMVTTKFYIDQTGDADVLYQKVAYFKDHQVCRGTKVDELYNGEKWQLDTSGNEYKGTILEHLLLQNLTAFYEVGEHNHIRLRDADWNDAIDMASKRGESVAFTNAYAMNLANLADILKCEKDKGIKSVAVFAELAALMRADEAVYDSIEGKKAVLDDFVNKCIHTISGETVELDIDTVISDLSKKSEWIKGHIRKTEWVEDKDGNGWFNGYYDNNGRRVEGVMQDGSVRMMLTGQVFSVMSGTATDEQVASIVKAADKYLYDEANGGYRLNTDFNEVKTDMGRMFGFAYGEKENGAVFSHMAVMYANALYKRGFVKEGFKSLDTLYRQSMNYEVSRIYPGIPEYFGRAGRGLYNYLTGAASWYMLTVVTQMFGARGECGDFVVEPKLLQEQFNELGEAGISLTFAGVKWNVTIINSSKLQYGDYSVKSATLDDGMITVDAGKVKITKDVIAGLDKGKIHEIKVELA